MKIKEKHRKCSAEVYGIYWAPYLGVMQRHHYIMLDDKHPGFIAVPESECEVTNPQISNFVLVKNSQGKDMLLHPILQEAGLLDRIVDADASATKYFRTKLKE